MNKMEKFSKSLQLQELSAIERKSGASLSEWGQPGGSEAELTACLLWIAQKRLGSKFTFDDAYNMTLDEANALTAESLEKLGFADDSEDADPKESK